MSGSTVAILAASLCIQVAAAILACRLLQGTSKGAPSRRAWLLISLALVLMAARRAVTLVGHFAPGIERPFKGLVAELIALTIAALMLAGVLSIARLFQAMHSNASKLQASLLDCQRVEAAHIQSRGAGRRGGAELAGFDPQDVKQPARACGQPILRGSRRTWLRRPAEPGRRKSDAARHPHV